MQDPYKYKQNTPQHLTEENSRHFLCICLLFTVDYVLWTRTVVQEIPQFCNDCNI